MIDNNYMDSNFKQFAAIASNWVPNNPVKAFLPFFYYFINKEISNGIKIENISKGLERVFGIHFPYHTILCTLNYLRSNGEANLEDNLYWVFMLKPENKKIVTVNFDDSKSALLIESLKNFYPNERYIQENAEMMLSSFFDHYDHDIMSNDINYENEKQFIEYDYFVAKFIENLERSNQELFDFVIQIAQGSIVKSTVLPDHYDVKFFNGTIYYLDTKIVLFLLGYYGDYFQKEYSDFINSLKSVGVKVLVTDYVVNEIVSILRSCEKYVDSESFRYEMSFDVLRYFRKNFYTSSDIRQMIISIEQDIEKCGIHIEKTPATFSNSDYPNEPYDVLHDYIKDVYGHFETDEFGNEYRAALETDIRSILYAYYKRNNNAIKSIRSAKVFFITTNRSLVRETNRYHEERYKKTISPIATDDFVGVLLLGATKNQAMPKIKMLAFCNECFDLGDEIRKKYIKKVEELNKNRKITDDELFLLKNSGIIDDALLNNYEKNGFLISDKCVFDVLADIKETMVGDLNAAHKREISSIKDDHNKEIESLSIAHKAEIDDANKNTELLKKQLFETKIKPHSKVFIIYYSIVIAFGLLAFAAVIFEICRLATNNNGIGDLIVIIFSAISILYSIMEILMSVIKKTAPVYNLFKNRYDKKVAKVREEIYKVPDSDTNSKII